MRYELTLTTTDNVQIVNTPFNVKEMRIINNTSNTLYVRRGSNDIPSSNSFDYQIMGLQVVTIPASLNAFAFYLDNSPSSEQVCTIIFNSQVGADSLSIREVQKQEIKLCANGTAITPVALTFNPVILMVFNNSDGDLYIRRGSQSNPSSSDYDYSFKANTSGSIPVEGVEYSMRLENATSGCVLAIFVNDYSFGVNTLPSQPVGGGGSGDTLDCLFDANIITQTEYSFYPAYVPNSGDYTYYWFIDGILESNDFNYVKTFSEGGEHSVIFGAVRNDGVAGFYQVTVDIGLIEFNFTFDFLTAQGNDIPNLVFVCADYALGVGARATQYLSGSPNAELRFKMPNETMVTNVTIVYDNTQATPSLGTNRISLLIDNLVAYNFQSWGSSSGTGQTVNHDIPIGSEECEVLQISLSYPLSSGSFKKIIQSVDITFLAYTNPFV